jgi:uncharacterized membrane protein YkvA (DUF1232 family)
MTNLNDTDRERVGETFERGVNDFTEDDLNRVRENAETAEKKSTHLGQQIESFRLTWSLLQDYWAGAYTAIPWKLTAAIGFAMAYLVSPLDVIPDFILFGFVDDAAVFGLVVSAFQSELEDYKEWKKNQKP